MPKVNWKNFTDEYRRIDTHWYVSKMKSYHIQGLNQLASGLQLLNKWFVDTELLTMREIKTLRNFLGTAQLSLLADYEISQLPFPRWTIETELFFTWQLDRQRIISSVNRPQEVLELYERVFQDIDKGATYEDLRARYGARLLTDIAANARNFISMYKKLGLAWVEPGRGITITPAGQKFMDPEIDRRAVIEKQAVKWQLYNPTVPRRYKELRVFPYVFLLKLLTTIEDSYITKTEYALFVSKARTMNDLSRVYTQISQWRLLDKHNQQRVINNLEKEEPNRRRPLFMEVLDSANKEIGFFCLTGSCAKEQIDGSLTIKLADRDRADELIQLVGKPVFIDFQNELDWFSYYGDWNKGATIDDAIEYYAQIGMLDKAEEVVKSPESTKQQQEKVQRAVREKDIENFFVERLNLIEGGLELYKENEKTGQQYPTEIGRIDILAVDKSSEFVVLEFKRDQSSDETVGQLLRYMGWVHINLADKRVVRGIIIASEVDEKTKYAIIGTQHPNKKELFTLYQHSFGIEKLDIGS